MIIAPQFQPKDFKAYNLLHEGILTLSEIEANGMRVNVQYLKQQLQELPPRIRNIADKLRKTETWAIWRRRFVDADLGSPDQLAELLYKVLKYPVTDRTEKGKPSTDIEALEKITDLPFLKGLLKMQKLEKALEVLQGIDREVVGDRLHPFFHLHTVQTYRSSSSNPNFQNFPVRDPMIAKIIRSVFVASEGCMIVENDYKGVEVSVSACYHKDAAFIEYIINPKKDMHRDMAAQLYMIDDMDWMKKNGKQHRYGAKNKFVFPEFYGDYYPRCAQSLWEWMERAELKAPGDIPLRQHLANKGIKKKGACDPEQKAVEGTFEHHVREVENDFWNRRFMEYGQWKKDWYAAYLEEGGFDTLTGFRIDGAMARNQVINYPVQGSAFHCLLWSLIRINKILKKRGMKSRIVGQIHDSIIGDVRVEELDEYLAIVKQVTTVDIRKDFDWLIVPLSVEVELAAPNGTWYDKKEVIYNSDASYSVETKNSKETFIFKNGVKLAEFLNEQIEQQEAA